MLLKLWFKALIFICLKFILTDENLCIVTVVHGVSFAEAVDFVTDSLVNIFPYIIHISRNTCAFMWCLRGNELTVYLASRINTEVDKAKLQKYT